MGNVTTICPTPAQRRRRRRLLAQQNLKMAHSAHAYVRGNTLHFYKWLNSRHAVSIPNGPAVICGDCHVGNLGPLATAARG